MNRPTTRPRRDVKEADRADVLAAAECRYCGDLIGPFEVDHVVPMSRGGTNARDNLSCACVSCNTQKGYHLLHEWMQWRKANGMFWPPLAQHSTDVRHYGDHCTPCWRRIMREDPEEKVPLPTAVPYQLAFDGAGYKCYFRCDCGNRWTCWYALGTWYYSDCACNYCVASRMEAES